MIKPFTTILGIMLIATQAFYLPARADGSEENTQDLTKYEISLEQDTQEFIANNHIVPGVAIYAQVFGLDEANRLAKDGVLIGKNSTENCIDLISGNVLLLPEQDLALSTGKGKISVANGAAVFVSASKNNLVIYDLMQTKPKQVSVSIGKQRVFVEPGRMLVITNKGTNDFEKSDLGCRCVTYRNAVAVDLGNKPFNAFMAEFSIASAMINIQPLQRLTVSSNDQDKLALQKMLKGALVLGEFATSTDSAVEAPNSVKAPSSPQVARADVADNILTRKTQNNN